MDWIGAPLGAIMRWCYQLVQNYGLAIILFTFATKLILFPVSLWVHINGIKMVQIQPAINRMKVQFFGDNDRIAEEQGRLYKENRYNPFLGVIPILVQLLLLIGLIQVIYHPLSYVLHMPDDVVQAVVQAAQRLDGIDAASNAAELLVLNHIQSGATSVNFLEIPGMTQELWEAMQAIELRFLGIDLSGVPATDGGVLILIPLLAGLASVLLSLSQNVINPLQAEQSKASQLGTMAFSVGLSLVLGFMIPAGVGFYWIFSNLFSILQQYVLNGVYKPQKHIDYAALEASKKEIEKYQHIGKKNSDRDKDEIKREKKDYKRFFSIVNKHLVFYSEKNGYFKYFEPTITYLLEHTNITIHYITSDPKDSIFSLAEKESRVKPYYIGEKKLITLMMKLDADVVVMTMPDLDNYHFKRSLMRKDIKYVYIFHYPLSTHMVLHTGALNHYDAILCVGDFQFAEIRKTEELYGLPRKELIACGYGQLESLYNAYQEMPKVKRQHPKILIAPSWQESNILDSCIDKLLSALLKQGFEVVVRPHPEYVKRYASRMEAIVQRYANYQGDDLRFELDFSSSQSIFDSDIVITDWSGTAYEFSFVTERPCVFIDTPPKINNPEYVKLEIEPLEFSLRDKIGIRIIPDQFEHLAEQIRDLLNDQSRHEEIVALRSRYIANFGNSGEIGGKYLIQQVRDQIEKKKAQQA